jgi:Domain of Unknown Function (DUF748)
MGLRRRVALATFALLVVLIAGALYALPEILRHVAVARIHSMTGRPVAIDAVELNIFRGRLAARGFRLAERDGQTPFVDFARLEVRVHLLPLLRGHFWIREIVLQEPVVRVVRMPDGEFNLSDLTRRSGGTGGPIDLTVDRFSLVGGTVTLQDRALPRAQTWRSEQIAVEARNVSTRGDDGTASASSVTAGAPVSIDMKRFRLYPIHLEATVTTEGLDVALATLYLPPDAGVIIDRGRASTSVTVSFDARDGLRADATARLQDIALVQSGRPGPVAVSPEVRVELAGFAFREGDLRLKRLAVAGTVGVPDPRVKQARRMQFSTVRADVADLTWPATTDGRLDVNASIPDGGVLSVAGTLRPPPAPTQLRVRLANLDLAPWTGILPLAARIAGIAEADLRMNEPLAAGVPARVQGSMAVNRLAVADARQELVRIRRVEANGIEVRWPERLVVGRVLVTEPHGLVERDQNGTLPLLALVRAPAAGGASGSGGPRVTADAPQTAAAGGPGDAHSASAEDARGQAGPRLRVRVGEIVIRNGEIAWRDKAVAPPARLDVSGIEATVTGTGWPLDGPIGFRLGLRPPMGGRLEAKGQLKMAPMAVDGHIAVAGAQLAPYQAYLPTTAGVSGTADADIAVVAPELAAPRAAVRGSASLSRVVVRDGERTILRLERGAATGLDVVWPGRVQVNRLALSGPWFLVERDERGALPLRRLLAARTGAPEAGRGGVADGKAAASGDPGVAERRSALAMSIRRLSVDEGGLRVVDRSVAPPFAVDLQRLALEVEGLSTAGARPAHVDFRGRIDPDTELSLRGSMGPIDAPLKIDMNGDLRRFGLPRTNPYVQRQVGWQVREGWLTTSLRVRIDGDALSAKTDVRVSQLQVARAETADEAKTRIGLPLGMIVALMKDGRGNIDLSFPVGGRLSDPRFDFREAIWGAVRTVATNLITLPVSWIGRVQMRSDSRIERIEIDPVRFRPGTATLTPEGQAQVSRLAAFMERLPEVRMTLTPAMSRRDRAELGRQAVDAAIDRIARGDGLTREAAAVRLFEERFPGRAAPASAEATWAVLAEEEPKAAAELPELAARRLEVIKASIKRARIDEDRLAEAKLVERQGPESEVELTLLEPEAPRSSPFRDFWRRLKAPFTRA